MAQAKTKVRINSRVASGEASPMVHQIPTPVMAPKTTVKRTKKLGVPFQIGQVVAVPGAIGVGGFDGQEQSAADGIVRDQDVDHRNRGDQHGRGQLVNVPPGKVHRFGSRDGPVFMAQRKFGFDGLLIISDGSHHTRSSRRAPVQARVTFYLRG